MFIPLGGPLGGVDVSEDHQEVVARLVVIPIQLGAAVEVNIVLPAVPYLVLVWETGVEGCKEEV